MTITVYPACALFAWIFVLSGIRRLPTMRREPERLAVWLMFLAFALVFTVGSSPLRRHLDGFAGVAEFSTWLAQSLVVSYSVAALALLQLWNYEPHQARHRVAASTAAVAAVLIAMAVLFFLSNPVHAGNHNFVHWYGASAYFDAYLIIYLVTYAATNIEIARLCLRFARLMTRCWLRTGLRTTAVGSFVSLVYAADRMTDVVVAHFGMNLTAWEAVPQAGAGVGSMLIMTGMTMPLWGPKASGLANRYRRLRAYRQLRPLWAALYARDPGIALDAPAPGIARWRTLPQRLRDLDYHVSRRVVEVRDGVLALHPYLDPDVTQHARENAAQLGLTGDELDAAIEAEQIRAALDASALTDRRRTQPRQAAMNNAPADLDSELAWLSAVSRHFNASPRPKSGMSDPVVSR
jgi:hypothetical protein